MIKVLMVGNHSSNKGGMTSVINQILQHNWKDEGIMIGFIPTFYPGNKIVKTLFFCKAYCQILNKIILNRPDLIYMHMSYKGSFTRKRYVQKTCKLFGIRVLVHLHGSEFEKWYQESTVKKQKRIRDFLRDVDEMIVLGEKWKTIIQKIEPACNVKIISNGIAIPHEKVNWGNDQINVLFLGVLIQRKGVFDLIMAAKEIKGKKLSRQVHYIIAGTGEEQDNLCSIVKDTSLNEEIEFVGWIDGEKKRKVILQSQIMVLPSYNEGLPISILEAASYGMPIIATNVGDISSVVENGVNGYLFDPGDIPTLSKSIINLCDKTTFEEMSKNSKRIIQEKFSIDVFYEKIKQEIVNNVSIED